MIHRTVPILQVKSWQEELQQLIKSPEALIKHLQLEDKWIEPAIKASAHFPLRATESYISKIKKGDPHDPLLRQILPIDAELHPVEGYTSDPLEEKQFIPLPGIVHKYQSRVLFIAATQCAINCRYCFRRHFPYNDHELNRQQWQSGLDYIQSSQSINEVILSGGDPFSLSDNQLLWLVEQISDIKHVEYLRVHTRYPIILPSRITPPLLKALTGTRLKTIVVVHCNHPQEIDKEVEMALKCLKNANVTLFNQSVLLKGINDSSQILATLSKALFQAGVQPYYIHLLDKVEGAAHFAVENYEAKNIYKELLTLLPGYLVPKLVKETAHEGSKTPVM